MALRWTWPDELRLVVATPSMGLATAKARAALPDDCCRGATRSSTCSACCRWCTRCSIGTTSGCARRVRDRWHQPARATLVPQLGDVLALDDPDVLGAFLSGAGPSVAVLARRNFERVEQLLSAMYARAGLQVTVRTLAVHQRAEHAERTRGARPRPGERHEIRVGTDVSPVRQAPIRPRRCGCAASAWGRSKCTYDYAAIKKVISRALIESRPRSLWRYLELLPVESPKTGFNSGFTPLVRPTRLARELGVAELYVKDDSVNHPTFSYKDRVVSVAATRAVELGFPVFGCASTGNLADSVAAHAARLGLPCYVFIPHDLEPNKMLGAAIYNPQVVAVEGNYDDVNRLCTQIADRYGWGFANINLRSYYAEGAKTMGFEIAEQLGWRYPDHIVSPVAGGTLLPRIYKGLREFKEVGLVDGQMPRIHAAQPTGIRAGRSARSRRASSSRIR